MGFSVRFFVALGVACVIRMTWAAECSVALQNCGSGQYNARNCQTGGLHSVLGYSCVACPDGYPESDVGTPQTINDCYKLDNCKYYHGGQVADGEGYHVENNTCYPNTQACSDFSHETENGGISCAQSSQQGQAEWNGNAWNVGNCACDITNVEIGTGPFGIPWWCDSFNADFHVSSANQNVSSASGKIVYTLSRMYCAKCHPGYLPKIENAQVDGVYSRPDSNGNWGVVMCNEQVSAPDYAPGCVIDFDLSMDDMMAECRKPCPDGFATGAPGATRVEECQYDGHTRYTDDTGTFYIGSLEDCP